MLNNLQQLLPQEQISEEELYKTWKKNTPLLYDTLVTHVLDWPTLTTQFLPINQQDSDGLFDTFKMVLGTQTDGNVDNYLIIAKVLFSVIFLKLSYVYQMTKAANHWPKQITH